VADLLGVITKETVARPVVRRSLDDGDEVIDARDTTITDT
jgi:hypothetical protein